MKLMNSVGELAGVLALALLLGASALKTNNSLALEEDVHKCCTLVIDHGVNPTRTWGQTTSSQQWWWSMNHCDTLVGGEGAPQCKAAGSFALQPSLNAPRPLHLVIALVRDLSLEDLLKSAAPAAVTVFVDRTHPARGIPKEVPEGIDLTVVPFDLGDDNCQGRCGYKKQGGCNVYLTWLMAAAGGKPQKWSPSQTIPVSPLTVFMSTDWGTFNTNDFPALKQLAGSPSDEKPIQEISFHQNSDESQGFIPTRRHAFTVRCSQASEACSRLPKVGQTIDACTLNSTVLQQFASAIKRPVTDCFSGACCNQFALTSSAIKALDHSKMEALLAVVEREQSACWYMQHAWGWAVGATPSVLGEPGVPAKWMTAVSQEELKKYTGCNGFAKEDHIAKVNTGFERESPESYRTCLS